MTASAWVAIGSLGLGLVFHIVVIAFSMGKLSQRVTNVERDSDDRGALNNMVIELRVKMEHVEGHQVKQNASLEGIQRQLGNIAMGRIGVAGEMK